MPTLTTSIQHNTKDLSSATNKSFLANGITVNIEKNLWSQQKAVRTHEFCKSTEYINVQRNQPHFCKPAVNELLEMN